MVIVRLLEVLQQSYINDLQTTLSRTELISVNI